MSPFRAALLPLTFFALACPAEELLPEETPDEATDDDEAVDGSIPWPGGWIVVTEDTPGGTSLSLVNGSDGSVTHDAAFLPETYLIPQHVAGATSLVSTTEGVLYELDPADPTRVATTVDAGTYNQGMSAARCAGSLFVALGAGLASFGDDPAEVGIWDPQTDGFAREVDLSPLRSDGVSLQLGILGVRGDSLLVTLHRMEETTWLDSSLAVVDCSSVEISSQLPLGGLALLSTIPDDPDALWVFDLSTNSFADTIITVRRLDLATGTTSAALLTVGPGAFPSRYAMGVEGGRWSLSGLKSVTTLCVSLPAWETTELALPQDSVPLSLFVPPGSGAAWVLSGGWLVPGELRVFDLDTCEPLGADEDLAFASPLGAVWMP